MCVEKKIMFLVKQEQNQKLFMLHKKIINCYCNLYGAFIFMNEGRHEKHIFLFTFFVTSTNGKDFFRYDVCVCVCGFEFNVHNVCNCVFINVCICFFFIQLKKNNCHERKYRLKCSKESKKERKMIDKYVIFMLLQKFKASWFHHRVIIISFVNRELYLYIFMYHVFGLYIYI